MDSLKNEVKNVDRIDVGIPVPPSPGSCKFEEIAQ